MAIFEPEYFFDMAGLFTASAALLGLIIAYKTYLIAKEAKDEWKLQKDLDFNVRFSKVFTESRNYIEYARSFPNSTEIDPQYLENNGKKIDEVEKRIMFVELVVLTRRKAFESMLSDCRSLLHESSIYFKEDHTIPKYLKFIIDTDINILNSAKRISFNHAMFKEFGTDLPDEDKIRTSTIEAKRTLEKEPDDEISKQLNLLFSECEKYLSSIREKVKYPNS